jgi:type I restriction enzyme M protein
MMIKDNDPANIKYGSTLATDDFAGMRFDFMLSNPPYGKSWKSDQKIILDGKDMLDTRFEVELKNFKGETKTEPAIPRSSDGQLLFLMDMVSKMKRLTDSPLGSRLASVHNGSSLFTGDANSGESNIRRYIIENDWLEAIIQMPNNLFYNTGITTYIWVLSNNKPAYRKGKVQLIDASDLYRKLRKNLGAKNCEFAPEHIDHITQLYLEMPHHEAGNSASANGSSPTNNSHSDRNSLSIEGEGWGEGVRPISKVFDNSDFGYYKVTVERPLRLAAQFTPDRIATLRFVPTLREIMEWTYERWGEAIYTTIADHKKTIEDHIEREEIILSPKNRKALFAVKTWTEQKALMEIGEQLMVQVGQELSLDFNQFKAQVDAALKNLNIKLSSSEKSQILNAVSWRDENAAKVIKKVHKLAGEKLDQLLNDLETTADHLPDYGFFLPLPEGEACPEPSRRGRGEGPNGTSTEYESDSELRDTENVPLKEDIHSYFLREVRPHVDDAWLSIDKTQIGYEISFNKYFYQHEPLRSLEEVTTEILALEQETEGLLKRLVSFAEAS